MNAWGERREALIRLAVRATRWLADEFSLKSCRNAAVLHEASDGLQDPHWIEPRKLRSYQLFLLLFFRASRMGLSRTQRKVRRREMFPADVSKRDVSIYKSKREDIGIKCGPGASALAS